MKNPIANFVVTLEELTILFKHLTDIENILGASKLNDIDFLFLSTYDQAISFLEDKYGTAEGNYFLDKQCQQPNYSIKRASEGLEIHHYYEFQERGLSNPPIARLHPFEYQKKRQFNLL